MTTLSRPADPNPHPKARDMRWSRSEKAVARKAFDGALKGELQEVMQETKLRASRIREPSELWDLEHRLTQRRKDIDRRYDSRYSHLTDVLGRLMHEKRCRKKTCAAWGRTNCN